MSKRIAITLVIAFVVTAQVALACSCGYVPLCQRIDDVRVLFVGTALETNDDHDGIKGGIWYRFSVEESFKGLPSGTREVIVDPASGTSCQSEYTVGKRYLISSYGLNPINQPTAAISVGGFPRLEGKRPEGIVIVTGSCSGSSPIEDAAEDLAFARQYTSNPQAARIFGFARINANDTSFNSFPGLKDVEITLTGEGHRYRQVTDKEGRFEIGDVAPGVYLARPALNGYKSQAKEYEITVPAHGCGLSNMSMLTDSRVSGRVLLEDGSPARSVQVEYMYGDPRYRHVYLENSRTETDSQGRFRFREMPSGNFYIGVNIKSPPDSETPFLRTYWPGVIDIQNAGVVSLKPNETKENLQFRLGPRSKERIVTIKVFWPDGKPAIDAAVDAKVDDVTAEFEKTDSSGEARLRLLAGVPYSIWAFGFMANRVTASGIKVLESRMDAEAISLAAGSEPAEFSLVLSNPLLPR